MIFIIYSFLFSFKTILLIFAGKICLLGCALSMRQIHNFFLFEPHTLNNLIETFYQFGALHKIRVRIEPENIGTI